MKRFFILSFLSLLIVPLSSCNTQQKTMADRQYEQNLEESFIESFKTLSFCKCLEYGYNGTLNLATEDASCRFPDYMYGQGSLIDSLARLQSEKIKLDAADRMAGRVAEGMEGKAVIKSCLEFYKSKELNALAKARYNADRKGRAY